MKICQYIEDYANSCSKEVHWNSPMVYENAANRTILVVSKQDTSFGMEVAQEFQNNINMASILVLRFLRVAKEMNALEHILTSRIPIDCAVTGDVWEEAYSGFISRVEKLKSPKEVKEINDRVLYFYEAYLVLCNQFLVIAHSMGIIDKLIDEANLQQEITLFQFYCKEEGQDERDNPSNRERS